MSLGQHLVEFRGRLVKAALAVLVASIGGFLIADVVWSLLAAPLIDVANDSGRIAQINYTSISEAFDTKIAIALTVGIVASSPIWLWQIWSFVTPALVRREKRFAFGFLLTAIPLFLLGCGTGWWLFPHVVELMTSFAPEGSTTLLTAKYYLDFSIKFVIAIGIGFDLPVFLVLLNFTGVLSAKAIISGWRWAIVGITTFTALATPAADVVSMFLLAIPMLVLYFLAAFVAWIRDRRVARKLAKAVA
ncbi:MAG: twin-arginine translocase subunit TatC [Actinomycetota bacterium]|jgi:sec-independent protein translocase protein TatC